MKRCTRARRTVLALLLTGLTVSATGCGGAERVVAAGPAPGASEPVAPPAGTPVASPVQPPTETPAASPDAPAPLPSPAPSPGTGQPIASETAEDGTWSARVVRAESGVVVLDEVEILSGAAAETARAEDGRRDPGADVPYVRNRNSRLRTVPVADDVQVQVIDCPQDGCGLVPWAYADLVAGRPLPYGTPSIPFSVTVVDGRVVALTELYFP